ncbi:MAG: AEC family transporter [Saccharofermentans sp.]|nr:AEC family transporter [Saccharofermentans sp.]
MSITLLIKVFIQMAVCIVVGFSLRKSRVIDERTHNALSDVLLRAVLPFTIIASSQYEYSANIARSIVAVALGATAYYVIMLFVIWIFIRNSKWDDNIKRVFITMSVFGNTNFVGISIMSGLMGSQGLLLAAVYNLVFNLFFYTMGAHLLSKGKNSFYDILINPVSLVSVLSIILFFIRRLPVFITDTISIVGNMTFPLSMIILGSMLTTVEWKKLFTDYKSYIVAASRLVVLPLLMMLALVVARNFVEISGHTLFTLVIMTALPAGTMNAIFAEKYNCAPKFCARTVTLTLFFMVVTLPLIISMCYKFF